MMPPHDLHTLPKKIVFLRQVLSIKFLRQVLSIKLKIDAANFKIDMVPAQISFIYIF